MEKQKKPRFETDGSGAIVIKMSLGELIERFDKLKYPPLTQGVEQKIARTQAINLLDQIFTNVEITIPNQEVKDKIYFAEESFDSCLSKLVEKYINRMFDR